MERKPTAACVNPAPRRRAHRLNRTPLLSHPSINGLSPKRVVRLPDRFSVHDTKQVNRPSHLPYLLTDAYYYLVSGASFIDAELASAHAPAQSPGHSSGSLRWGCASVPRTPGSVLTTPQLSDPFLHLLRSVLRCQTPAHTAPFLLESGVLQVRPY